MVNTAVDRANAERSRAEVAEFTSEQPDQYFAYHSAGRGNLARGTLITTWTGDPLGRVLEAGEPYVSNFGDRRQSFRMLSAGMCSYSGTAYLSAGDYVRMRKVASRKVTA
jgi:hypothetical protein